MSVCGLHGAGGQDQEFGIPSVGVYLRWKNLMCNASKESMGVEKSSCGSAECSSCCYKGFEHSSDSTLSTGCFIDQ